MCYALKLFPAAHHISFTLKTTIFLTIPLLRFPRTNPDVGVTSAYPASSYFDGETTRKLRLDKVSRDKLQNDFQLEKGLSLSIR